MDEALGIFLCLLIVIMDITAGILGIIADLPKTRQPSHKAFMLGLSAIVLLALAHLTVNLVAGYHYLHSRQKIQNTSSNRKPSKKCFILTWIILGVGLSMLLMGTCENYKLSGSSEFTHQNFFFSGGTLCFVHALTSVYYYIISATTIIN